MRMVPLRRGEPTSASRPARNICTGTVMQHGTLPGGSIGVLLGRGYSLGTLRGVSGPSVDAWGVEIYIYIYIYIHTHIYTLHV